MLPGERGSIEQVCQEVCDMLIHKLFKMVVLSTLVGNTKLANKLLPVAGWLYI